LNCAGSGWKAPRSQNREKKLALHEGTGIFRPIDKKFRREKSGRTKILNLDEFFMKARNFFGLFYCFGNKHPNLS
jgi:hypothetical protein